MTGRVLFGALGRRPTQGKHGHVPFMNLFGSSTDTVDGKARSILGDLPEDPSPYEILKAVDQKAGDNLDPDDVASKLCDLDDEVDAKLSSISGEGVDQKEMRQAAGTIAEQSDLSSDDAMELLSAVSRGDVDQAALTDLADNTDPSDMGNEPDTSDDGSGTDPGDAPDGGDVDQKQDDDGGGNDMSPLDIVEQMGDSDARDTVETYAESVNKDPQDAAAEWIAENVPGITVEGYGGGDGGGEQAAPEPDQGANKPDRQAQPAVDQMSDDNTPADTDQKAGLDDINIDERVADAVTSDEVMDEMAGALIQRMADNDDVADQLVQTVEQKGDFATTDDTVVTAPSNDSQTVGEAGAITGGNGGDDE